MRDSVQATPSQPSAGVSVAPASLPPDVVRLVDVLARIELRRQARLAVARNHQQRAAS